MYVFVCVCGRVAVILLCDRTSEGCRVPRVWTICSGDEIMKT